jgi:hypothetical protein
VSNIQHAELDNEMLGLKMATEDELEELPREASKSTRYEADAKVWLSIAVQRLNALSLDHACLQSIHSFK